MSKNHNSFERFSNFITGKGFYLAILICVAAIGLSGFYLIRSVSGRSELGDDQPVGGTASIVSPSPSASVRPSVQPTPTVSPSPVPTTAVSPSPSAEPKPSASPTAPVQSPKPSASPAPLVFTWPVKGSILSGYCVDALAYDVTMGDWRTHNGIDIAADVGTPVKATAAGTVSDVFADDLLGTVVVVDHGSNLTSLYANLTAVPTVKAGDKVSTGTVLGAVGRTASAESGQKSHLHFAMFVSDQSVSPEDFLPEQG